MGKKLEKFFLLMWKNLLLQYRKPFQTIIELIIPVLFIFMLVYLRSVSDPKKTPDTTFPPFCVIPYNCLDLDSDTPHWNTSYRVNIAVVYSPNTNTALRRSMDLMENVFTEVIGYSDSKILETHFTSKNATAALAGIQLDDSLANRDTLPDDVEVIIRFPSELHTSKSNNWHTNLLYSIFDEAGPREPDRSRGPVPYYYDEGFLALQMMTTLSLAIGGYHGASTFEEFETKLTSFLPPVIKMQRFPHSSWTVDPMLDVLNTFVDNIVTVSFLYSCINIAKAITTEKEKQLKEAMKIMGLPNWLHWTAWFIKSFIFLFIAVILMTVMLKVSWYSHTEYSVLTYADPTVILVFLTMYICATITFCFATSALFSHANTAVVVTGLFWLLSLTPQNIVNEHYAQLSLFKKLLPSLGINTAMALGFKVIVMYEGKTEGVQWSNIGLPSTTDDNLSLGHIMIMLVVDTFIYLIFAIYVEGVFPGEYGVPLPWNFPFTASYWCGHKRSVRVADFETTPTNHGEFFEEEPNDLNAGIQIKNLRKVFRGKAAVVGLSLNMYEDQITVLLGHNGAGKTTTMSMLTGMFPPTSGTAVINGCDISTDMDGVRASLGLCPQYNILFDELTVSEHIYFFSKLKGLKKKAIKEEIKKYIELLELQPKRKAKSSTLSGGMKRKLCVAIALCGNSKVVMLDEPTAGMDPSARRALWELIQGQKDGRTMLLSTHFMDEADLLGDRIAIMAGGKLQCCGSSFFLKKKYGAGYNLIMDKSPSCQPAKVTQLLQKYIPDIQIHSNVGSELSYLLAENQSSVFEIMLQDLEKQSSSLGIQSYGISLTTLEEVFMKVGADHGHEESNVNVVRKNLNQKRGTSKVNQPETEATTESSTLLSGFRLILNQFLAMLMKKILSAIRNWILLLMNILIPVCLLTVMLAIEKSRPVYKLPKLPITLDSYHGPVTLVEELTTSKYSELYAKTLQPHEVQKVSNMTQVMLNLTKTQPAKVREKYIAGATFEQSSESSALIIAWFNNNAYHSAPLALALVLNMLYKEIAGSNKSISFANYPLDYSIHTKLKMVSDEALSGFFIAMVFGLSMAFVSSFYVLFYIRERVCKSKHLQFVSGVKVYVFWITSFLCDLITFSVIIIAVLIVFACFQVEGFRSSYDLSRISLLLFSFAIAVLPMMYVASHLFEIPATGFTRMTLFGLVMGVACLILSVTLHKMKSKVFEQLHPIFLLAPHYSLTIGIVDIHVTTTKVKMCKSFVESCLKIHPDNTEDMCWDEAYRTFKKNFCAREADYFKWERPGIGRNLVYCCAVGIVLFLVLILMEYKIFSKILYKIAWRFAKLPHENPDEDRDVSEERQMIKNTPESELRSNYVMVLKDLTKYYKKFLAVNGLCLGVKQFECFGLLGVNGAGKTTTFEMLTGDLKITHGDVWIKSYSIKTDIKNVQRMIGYCPQFDALLDDLTAKESLTIFALLRGVPLRDCDALSEKLSTDFDFHRHLNKKVKELSGGNKRKLSTAISLIGDPPLIYLDEPTTGMDPATKRYLWDALSKVRDSGKCIVLTSHSMEECEALCTRLAIMVNGNFKCLGSTQHLKSKFAEGYMLTLKLKKTHEEAHVDTKPIERFMARNFPNAIERERHKELLAYCITDKTMSWSKMFGIMEKNKKQLNIEDYSLGQSSLEQVFLLFTKLQR